MRAISDILGTPLTHRTEWSRQLVVGRGTGTRMKERLRLSRIVNVGHCTTPCCIWRSSSSLQRIKLSLEGEHTFLTKQFGWPYLPTTIPDMYRGLRSKLHPPCSSIGHGKSGDCTHSWHKYEFSSAWTGDLGIHLGRRQLLRVVTV